LTKTSWSKKVETRIMFDNLRKPTRRQRASKLYNTRPVYLSLLPTNLSQLPLACRFICNVVTQGYDQRHHRVSGDPSKRTTPGSGHPMTIAIGESAHREIDRSVWRRIGSGRLPCMHRRGEGKQFSCTCLSFVKKHKFKNVSFQRFDDLLIGRTSHDMCTILGAAGSPLKPQPHKSEHLHAYPAKD
jgi:hypothetical protein